MQSTLLQKFPMEAGKTNLSERVIPTLPSKSELLRYNVSRLIRQTQLVVIKLLCH